MEALIFGQALELYWKFHKQCPSMSEYLVMIDNKTGGFFRLVMRLMIAEAPSSVSCADKLSHFATVLGRFYQIRDDYQNLVSEEVSSQFSSKIFPVGCVSAFPIYTNDDSVYRYKRLL